MRVNNKKIYDDATMVKAAKLLSGGEHTIKEILKELHTSLTIFNRSMDWYFRRLKDIKNGETDWKAIFRAKRRVVRKKRDTRIVYECQACSYEEDYTTGSFSQMKQCPKCGSFSVEQKELRNRISLAELKSIKMTGRRFMKPKSK